MTHDELDARLSEIRNEIREVMLDIAKLSSRLEALESAYVAADNNVLQVIKFVREGLQTVAKDVKVLSQLVSDMQAAHARTAALVGLFSTIFGGLIVTIVTYLINAG